MQRFRQCSQSTEQESCNTIAADKSRVSNMKKKICLLEGELRQIRHKGSNESGAPLQSARRATAGKIRAGHISNIESTCVFLIHLELAKTLFIKLNLLMPIYGTLNY